MIQVEYKVQMDKILELMGLLESPRQLLRAANVQVRVEYQQAILYTLYELTFSALVVHHVSEAGFFDVFMRLYGNIYELMEFVSAQPLDASLVENLL